MYELVNNAFPHLSDEDRIKIGQFALDYTDKETKSLWDKIERIYAGRAISEVEIDNIQ